MTDSNPDDRGAEIEADAPSEAASSGQAEREGESGDRTKIVFVGDSLTEAGDWEAWFPDLEVINLGVSGTTTDSLNERFDQIVAHAPDEIVLMIGTNDLGTRQTVEHLVRNIENFCVQLRKALPGSRMLVQSVLPRGREYAHRIQEANIHLRQFSSTVRAQFLDLWPAMALEDGELNPSFSPDRLHLNEAGYEAWLNELRPALARLRELPPMTTPISIIDIDRYSRPTRR